MADHPVKVPEDLVNQWWKEAVEAMPEYWPAYAADRAAQWGADQQLLKVNDWIRCLGDDSRTGIRWELEIVQLDRLGRELWQAMRPKPPTLAEQALKAAYIELVPECKHGSLIISALNRLAELEAQQ